MKENIEKIAKQKPQKNKPNKLNNQFHCYFQNFFSF